MRARQISFFFFFFSRQFAQGLWCGNLLLWQVSAAKLQSDASKCKTELYLCKCIALQGKLSEHCRRLNQRVSEYTFLWCAAASGYTVQSVHNYKKCYTKFPLTTAGDIKPLIKSAASLELLFRRPNPWRRVHSSTCTLLRKTISRCVVAHRS